MRDSFAQLWSISLVRCPPDIPERSLEGLQCFACLGFLDLSFTKFKLQTLQRILRPIQILRLHCFESFTADVQKLSSETTRGFISFAIPTIWSMNGIMFTCDERFKWENHFEYGKGQYSEIYRKHFVDFDPRFVPTRLLSQAPFNNQSLSRESIEDISSFSSSLNEPLPGTLWSHKARSLVYPVPGYFAMGFDQDIWRCSKLAKDLESHVAAHLKKETNDIDKINDIGISHFISAISTGSDGRPENTFEWRTFLLLLLVGSLLYDFPQPLMQSVLGVLFDKSFLWTNEEWTPTTWPLQLRLYYSALLLARTSIKSPTEHQHSDEDDVITLDVLNSVGKLIAALSESVYDQVSQDFHSQIDEFAVNKSFDALCITPLDQKNLAILSLQFLRLFMLIQDDVLLMDYMDFLLFVLDQQLQTLWPDDSDRQEKVYSKSFVYEKKPTGERFTLMSYKDFDLSLEAKGLEFRFRFLSTLDQVLELTVSDIQEVESM
jgi:hypothetical protein